MNTEEFQEQPAPVFFQYHPKNCIDWIIKLFQDKGGWKIQKLKENKRCYMIGDTSITLPGYECNEWPDITLSDKRIREHINNYEYQFKIEYLGQYNIESKTIILYTRAIQDMARCYQYAEKPDFTLKRTFEIFTEIILVHELAHWLMHVGCSKRFSRDHYHYPIINFAYSNDDEIKYHESFAQIFTNYFCATHKDKRYWSLFEWLEAEQPPNYTVYLKLVEKGKNSEDGKIIDDLSKVFDLFNFTRELELQSMKALIKLSDNITYPLNNSDKRRLYYTTIIASHDKSLKEKLIDLYPDYSEEIDFACEKSTDLIKHWHEKNLSLKEYKKKYNGKIKGEDYGL